MPTLTIDNRSVEVPPGATILEAARKLGIEIPTLCFLEGYRPATSCQVCMVRLVDSQRIVPSCATVAVEGMRVESETPEVHRIRRVALELLLSDHVGDCFAPCVFACPAHMDVPKMLREIGTEDLPSAIATIKEDIALPAILGRVCPKPCEKGCRRSGADGPVEVCDLKRYVADLDLASGDPYVPPCRPDSGKRVAVVGAGPTGLAAAFHLRCDGHAVTVFEAEPRAGGRLRCEFLEELPVETLEAEIHAVVRAGIELVTGTRVGEQVTLAELCDRYDAVLVACGAIEGDRIADWGLKIGRRGIEIRKGSFETNLPGVFAAGNAIRGKGLVVRSVADGKEAAGVISQYLAGGPITPVARPFASRMGRLADEELEAFLGRAAPVPRRELDPSAADSLSLPVVSEQAHRCMACGCVAEGDCRLERYAAMYGADPGRLESQRRPFVLINRESSVVYEPGKCIRCELCIQIAAQSKEALGLSFVGRGFDVVVGVPFDGTMEEALGDVADQCIAACPTGALYRRSDPTLVQLEGGGLAEEKVHGA